MKRNKLPTFNDLLNNYIYEPNKNRTLYHRRCSLSKIKFGIIQLELPLPLNVLFIRSEITSIYLLNLTDFNSLLINLT